MSKNYYCMYNLKKKGGYQYSNTFDQYIEKSDLVEIIYKYEKFAF